MEPIQLLHQQEPIQAGCPPNDAARLSRSLRDDQPEFRDMGRLKLASNVTEDPIPAVLVELRVELPDQRGEEKLALRVASSPL